MSLENIQTKIIITDANREELERLYGKMPPENELLEAPQTHSLEESNANSLDKFNEREETPDDEISQQNL
ncbi:MAG: hypothetical protein FWG14_06150 [Peptococcaceae bacterium]|nr:hypothetical protein [Peptococcaceae bacterium]